MENNDKPRGSQPLVMMPRALQLDDDHRGLLDITLEAQLGGRHSVTGRRLRAASTAKDSSAALQALVPQHLLPSTGSVLDEYSLTLRGLLETRIGLRAAEVIGDILKFLREEFQKDPDFPEFSWKQLMDRVGFLNSDLPIVACMLEVAGLTGGGGVNTADPASTKWRTHVDIERMVKCETAPQLLSLHDASSRKLQETQTALASRQRRKAEKFGLLDSPAQRASDVDDYQDLPLGFLFLDVDNFKSLNVRFGHVTVDEHILKPFLELIASLVEGRGHAYQQGGDEVTILLRNSRELSSVAFAEELRRAVEECTFMARNEQIALRVSVGVATTSGGTPARELLNLADLAEQRAKAAGGNRVVLAYGSFHSPSFADVGCRGVLGKERQPSATRRSVQGRISLAGRPEGQGEDRALLDTG